MPIPRLETGRLTLREWGDADREPFAKMNADSRVMEHFPALLDRAASDALLNRIREHWAAHGFGLWAVERQADGRFLGYTGLAAPPFEAHFTPAVEIGWRFAVEAWGQGRAGRIIKESLTALYREGRFLGGARHLVGDAIYVDTNEGDVAGFRGVEWIELDGTRVYELVYHGGLVKD